MQFNLSLSPINRRPHIAQKKKPPQVSPRRLSPQRLFVGVVVGVDIGTDDGMVIVSIIGCGFGILLHGRLRKGRGISRQLLLAHARRALLGRHAGRLGVALLLGRQDIALALKVSSHSLSSRAFTASPSTVSRSSSTFAIRSS